MGNKPTIASTQKLQAKSKKLAELQQLQEDFTNLLRGDKEWPDADEIFEEIIMIISSFEVLHDEMPCYGPPKELLGCGTFESVLCRCNHHSSRRFADPFSGRKELDMMVQKQVRMNLVHKIQVQMKIMQTQQKAWEGKNVSSSWADSQW